MRENWDLRSATNDSEIAREICRITAEIETWVKSQDLWGDCGFHSYTDFVDAEPWRDYPVVTIFASDGDFNGIFESGGEELYEKFSELLRRNGYWFERDAGLVYILSANENMNVKFKEYFHWQWVCSLLKPDFNDIHHELFQHFDQHPQALLKLQWREFEVLIYELLRNQGFRVELGPGRADGGIDIKMFQRDPIGDILTGVQIKRYRPDRTIDLQAVQALHGAAVADGIPRTAFVTTSRYSPSAKKFANRKNVRMSLFLSSDVVEWCKDAHRGIIEDKTRLISKELIEKTLIAAQEHPNQHVVHAHTGVTMSLNSFAVKLKESKHAALLMELPSRIISHDGHKQRGYEVPVMNPSIRLCATSNSSVAKPGRVFRAKKTSTGNSNCRYWTGKALYTPSMATPQWFDVAD